MSLGPFDLTGQFFLILYGALFVMTVAAGIVVPRWMRPSGRPQRVTDADELAYLAGSAARFGDALVARLLATGALTMIGKDQFLARPVPTASSAEHSVLALSEPIRWREIDRTLKSYAEPIERRLTTAGLLMTGAERANVRFWALLPYLMLLVFGATKWVIGDMRERPVGYLTVALIVTLVFAIFRWASIDRRTQAGRDAIAEATASSRRLKAAPTQSEVGIAVALFGTGVLTGSAWSDFHRLRTSGGSDGGGGSGDSGGDGGCGGGGCGGCGS